MPKYKLYCSCPRVAIHISGLCIGCGYQRLYKMFKKKRVWPTGEMYKDMLIRKYEKGA